MRVANIVSERTGRGIANQFVIRDNERNSVYFQSYESVIALVNNGCLFLDKDKWNYSRTTAKYRNMFVREYFSSDYASKEGIKEGIKEGKIIMTELNN